MRLCKTCGVATVNDNYCSDCADARNNAKKARTRDARKARDEARRSCGLVKVKGAFGGTYWE